ncbi:IS1634 family transposase [Phytoactinopolyspora limicola]|uniref:IS1634 family transposase n=1 Tax=Phytoactinopolyspora limicola TaxID=2715536 RepID=UPI0014072C09|nr:IS1634 family transposase [Phytoactinopolyspora limicola]
MRPYIRRVRTASGATAVQIAEKVRGRTEIHKHIGSAHTEAELAALLLVAHDELARLNPGQGTLDLGLEAVTAGAASAVVESMASRMLTETIRTAYARLGFTDAIGDEVFYQLVLARLVEPTSKLDSIRVLDELGLDAAHHNTLLNALKRARDRDYRGQVAKACFAHSAATSGLALCLYDVTSLHFEAEHEDEYRKVGYSKQRRVDPQIIVGLLVDRSGFPLEIHSYQGNTAETHTIVPVVKEFQQRHNIADMVVVADAGMLSADNLQALDDAGMRFIVGSKATKAPQDLAKHFRWHGTHHDDGQTVDTVTMRHGRPDAKRTMTRAEPVWDPHEHPDQWRAVWQYRRKRALKDQSTLNKQRNRAIAIIDGQTKPKKARFVKETNKDREFDQATYDRAMELVGWKGYCTNIEASIMPAAEVVSSYHQLWHVEQSFRMSKSDLRARPIFHRVRDAIEAHLTIVFTALAIARYMQSATGLSLNKIIQTLRPLRDVTININGHKITATPQTSDTATHILTALGIDPGY